VADNFPRGRTDIADSPKSHYLRSVPLADRLAGELERHFQRSAYRADDDLVFCHPQTGVVYDASTLRSRFYDCVARVALRFQFKRRGWPLRMRARARRARRQR
jgi:hypothetical protein